MALAGSHDAVCVQSSMGAYALAAAVVVAVVAVVVAAAAVAHALVSTQALLNVDVAERTIENDSLLLRCMCLPPMNTVMQQIPAVAWPGAARSATLRTFPEGAVIVRQVPISCRVIATTRSPPPPPLVPWSSLDKCAWLYLLPMSGTVDPHHCLYLNN